MFSTKRQTDSRSVLYTRLMTNTEMIDRQKMVHKPKGGSTIASCSWLNMDKDPLAEAGLYFDEVYKLRVLDPNVTQRTTELKEECKDFVDKTGQFQRTGGVFIEILCELAKKVEKEKNKAISARNRLKSVVKQREAKQQQLQALIAEKRRQLERYRIENEALSKVEAEQNEFINQFMLQT